jgi:sugar-phosphate isomerase, RpiB/LacA/LacB family
MKIGIGNDHHGIHLKQVISTYLEQQGYEVINFGTDTTENVDYTIYAFQVGEAVRDQKIDYGVLICGSGIGMSIACNKVRHVRCAKVNNVHEVEMTRRDNNANVMTLGETTPDDIAIEMVKTFLNTPFMNNERYQRRVKEIDNYDN